MTVHTSGNYAFKSPPFMDDDFVMSGNFAQFEPGTEICADVRNLTITGGNFVNCVPQPTWSVQGGNWTQVSRCSHKHPKWVKLGLRECRSDCEHRSPQPEVRVLTEDVVRERRRENAVLPELSSVQVVDDDEVPVLKHTVREYVYRDVVQLEEVVTHG